jgi:hypothetical protein
LCSNIANTGRDAPRHVRAGNVYDEYVVSGMFVYATSGHQDPLLYAQCNVDIFTKASDGVSPGDVRWVCHIHNSWENVAAGSTGNAGNPGPAGFTNDPQAISYRPEIDDGATDVLDWSGLDATVTSASNPIQATGGACPTSAGSFCMFVASSVGANVWYYGQATRAWCSGTCVAGAINGQLYYAYPASVTAGGSPPETRYVSLFLTPSGNESGSIFMTGSQGTGTTSFSTRMQHYHWETWQTLDASGQDNWSPLGTATRVTRKVYPAFTAAEKLYWQESGLIIPVNLSQPTPTVINPPYGQGGGDNYAPFGRMAVIGGAGTGPRPDLGISNEYAVQALITGTQQAWDNARLFTFGSSVHGYSTVLNEATGRIPVLNNGPPTGLGGNGAGGSYAGLGAPQNQLEVGEGSRLSPLIVYGVVDPVHNQPNASYEIAGGLFQGGTGLDHMPSFGGFTYAVFGDRHFLDMMYWQGNRAFLMQRVGPGPELGQGYYRDNNATFTDGHTYHYWGLLIDCCQWRGSAWLIRDVTYPATFGGDSNIERSYYNDFLTETGNYYPLFLAFKDGAGSTGFSKSILGLDNVGGGTGVDTFITSYIAGAAYIMQTFLHTPLAAGWNSTLQRFYEGVCGGQLSGAPVSFYCIDYTYQPQIHDGDATPVGFGGNVGQYMNGTDASDFGSWTPYTNILTGGQMSVNDYIVTAGDTLKSITGWAGVGVIDQLPGNQWFTIIGPIDNSSTYHTFYVKCPLGHAVDATCPTPGAAFTGFTRSGTPITNEFTYDQPKYRLAYDPGPGNGYANLNYVQYGGQTINGLHILGYNVSHATSDFNTRAGIGYYNPAMPSYWWDPTIVIPGLPTPHNGL